MEFRGFQEYRPNASRYNGRISEEEWNKHKPKLRELHEAKLTRQQILDIISKDFGDTKPTYGQLCTKFDKWGFHVYRQNERKETATTGKKAQRKNVKKDPVPTSVVDHADHNIQQALSPESTSDGSTVVPDFNALDLSDKATPRTIADIQGTPRSQYLEPSPNFSDSTPRAHHARHLSDQDSTPLGTIYEPDPTYAYDDLVYDTNQNTQPTQPWSTSLPSTSASTLHGNRSSISDTHSSRTSLYHTTSELINVEPDDPPTIAARTRKADEALDAVHLYLKSIGQNQNHEDLIEMVSLAAYPFATRSYSSAFRIYHKIYDIMSQDMGCDDISKLGVLMKCYQSAVEPQDLDFMQRELHQVLTWHFDDASLGAFAAQMLSSVEIQISEGFNLAQGSLVSTSSITRNLSHLMVKGTSSEYPGTKRLYWRLRLLKHSPFHSGCPRLLRLMSELLSWAWAAMAVLKFPDAAVPSTACLCKDGVYFDFVRMVTTVTLEAATGFEISQLIKVPALKQTPCACVMCGDLETTFAICPIETFTAIALLTVDRCRLDWTSCHPGGRHQELTPKMILHQQLLPTVELLLDQVAADIRSQTTIHTSDLYDDFLSCLWSCFETHDLPLKNARFDASEQKVEDMMTTLITEELNKTHPARNSTLEDPASGKMPVFTYGEANDELANKITAKRTRSNASALTKSSSNASERSMIRIRKKLKFRTSADYLNSMSSYSSLSSRNSMNRFSYVTGLPELETVMDDGELQALPPDLTPDEFRTMQRHDSWTRRSDHFSWVPSRPGSTVGRGSWRESNGQYTSRRGSENPGSAMAAPSSRPGSVTLDRRTSQKGYGPREQAMQNSMVQAEHMRQSQHSQNQNQAVYQQNHQTPQSQPQLYPQPVSQQSYYQRTMSSQPQSQPQQFPPHNMPPPQPQPEPQYQHSYQAQPVQQVQQQYNQSQSANSSSSSLQNQVDNVVLGNKPQRRDSNKTTKSKESQKGRWSSERKRVDGILSALQ
ncbi:hypothetical protein LTR05_006721 [Lithohypha guttulata]|uniref:Clr5 domain-containing protein n=1 Tax=Lithohypha guttulata TaxID=1690604 RepID=A0AAN7YE48_9EURO|nr:hypothetical protein LTR05_006721 [Lithohypha guttulata]